MQTRKLLHVASVATGLVAFACSGSEGGDKRTNSSLSEVEAAGGRVAQVVQQVNLVADQPGEAATIDPNLVNAWGLSFNPIGLAWIADAETGFSSVYDSAANLRLTVTIPGPNGQTGAPTGIVFNPDSTAFNGDRFIFVTENGTIAGWQPSLRTSAVTRIDDSDEDAVYKGAALANMGGQMRLYVTDFHNAKVEAYDSSYGEIETSGEFEDPNLPANYAPFNIVWMNDRLFVSFAKQALPDKEDDEAGPAQGIVDVFDTDGRLQTRLISHGHLNAPWGMAIAPAGWGSLANNLLVGNFGDGRINVYALEERGTELRAQYRGTLGSAAHEPLVIDGLWAIVFPPDAGGFHANDLYFTAGPDDEEHGLYGRLELAGEAR